jgi:hypothetical protein
MTTAGWFASTALRRLALGTPSNMGPGFFPLMIAGFLAAVALLLVIGSFNRASRIEEFVRWRALACILGAPLIFALAIAPLGFVPTMALTTLIAACSSSRMTWRFALSLTAGLTALCTGLFVKLLQMPVPAFGPWLSW